MKRSDPRYRGDFPRSTTDNAIKWAFRKVVGFDPFRDGELREPVNTPSGKLRYDEHRLMADLLGDPPPIYGDTVSWPLERRQTFLIRMRKRKAMKKPKRFEVRSDIDRGVVFDADAVDEEARIRRKTPRKAARLMAAESTDPQTGEQLYVSKEGSPDDEYA